MCNWNKSEVKEGQLKYNMKEQGKPNDAIKETKQRDFKQKEEK